MLKMTALRVKYLLHKKCVCDRMYTLVTFRLFSKIKFGSSRLETDFFPQHICYISIQQDSENLHAYAFCPFCSLDHCNSFSMKIYKTCCQLTQKIRFATGYTVKKIKTHDSELESDHPKTY